MSGVLRLLSRLSLVSLFAVLAGCHFYELPEPVPSREAVLDAAKEVVLERYPMSAVSDGGGYVLALSHPGLEGSTRTRRQVSVFLQRNYTGAYEPVVKVRHYADLGTAALDADPAGLAKASPFDFPRWRSLGYLVHEEQELTDAILRQLEAKGL